MKTTQTNSAIMLTAGIDYHKRHSVVDVLDRMPDAQHRARELLGNEVSKKIN